MPPSASMNLAMYKKIAQIKIGEQIFKREYKRIIEAVGGNGHHLVDQYELQRLGHPYYNSRAAGGEGHLEVAKNIYYSHKGLAHMVLALKPFGCMPSTQSDGAQSAVMSHYKDMIFLPIETSGEGDVNAHSRVQMALGEAKAKTKLEFKAALEATGRTLEEIRAYVGEHPELKSPTSKFPPTQAPPSAAANFLLHDTKQAEKVLEFLKRMEAEGGIAHGLTRIFITGSGGGGIAPLIGAKFVQEVNAVALAVEKLYPQCGSVIELGGQDAKIIIFKEDPATGRKKKIPSMNDKCAGGTGAVIDKINAKLRIPSAQLCEMGYKGLKLHPVAGKCGVFAETDINGLQKMGVPPDELMASLFEAIVMQNLSVLTRGNTLLPVALLLGGPNCYVKGMRDCWKANIPKLWEERGTVLPEGIPPEDLIKTPDNAQYFAAIGSVEFGKREDDNDG